MELSLGKELKTNLITCAVSSHGSCSPVLLIFDKGLYTHWGGTWKSSGVLAFQKPFITSVHSCLG